ncbi:MAG: hypothetical protein IKC52_01825 [Clostridia bacterium]|nr:hypothetical protein [Clostridia bacterium]
MSTKQTMKSVSSSLKQRNTIIAIICVVAAIVIAVLTILTFVPQKVKKPADDPTINPGSSTLALKNGDFRYVVEGASAFPQGAQDWDKYTHQPKSGSLQGFTSIDTTEKVVMGVVDTLKWDEVSADLTEEGITATNPETHEEITSDDEEGNVYMIATKTATNAGIMTSGSFTLSANASGKVTVWLNTEQLTEGNAFVMIKRSNSSALDSFWYSYDFTITQQEGWQCYEFYVFNRTTSSQTIKCNVGIGNIYNGDNAQGVIFADDIKFETSDVTLNDYRELYNDGTAQKRAGYAITATTEDQVQTETLNLVAANGTTNVSVLNTLASNEVGSYLNEQSALFGGKVYSPFTPEDGYTIYKLENDGTTTTPLALQLENNLNVVASATEADHIKITFWLRVYQNQNKLANANVLLKQLVDGEMQTVDAGSFTKSRTSQDIDTDYNCGWAQYQIFVKPADVQNVLNLVITLGAENGYNAGDAIPSGALYVTAPELEVISASDYNSSVSGNYKKVDLIGSYASTTVANGSFSNTATSTQVGTFQPENWAPVFAGDNDLYKDGKLDQITVPHSNDAISGSGIVKGYDQAPKFDDSTKSVLRINNNVATSFGYASNNITLAANKVYVISFLTKGTGNTYAYLVDNSKERDQAVVASFEANLNTASKVDNGLFNRLDESENGWNRAYFVVVTGDESMTVRIALFNGSLDGTQTQQGEVFYDKVTLSTIGSYHVHDDEIEFHNEAGYKVFDELKTSIETSGNVEIVEPDYDQIIEDANKEEDVKDDEEDKDQTIAPTVDWAVFFTALSSIILVAALLAVIVVKIFKKKR